MSTRPRAWYRSLYWRIGLGLIVFLALLLAAQGILFIYLTDRLAGSMPARSPRQLAVLVAAGISTQLEIDPSTDVAEYLRERYGHVFQPIAVTMRDGGTAVNRHDVLSEELLTVLHTQASLSRGAPFRRRGEDNGATTRPPRDRRADGPSSQAGSRTDDDRQRRAPRSRTAALIAARRTAEFAPIVVRSERVGLVAVPLGRPPISLVLRELGPTMGVVGLAVLLLGGGTMAFVVFVPARHRLLRLETATERLGTGDLTARAPEDGGDEVAALAHAFNRMAEDLERRAAALEASDAARRQLLADVSHELMTPLTAIRGYIETLSMKALAIDGETHERYLGIVDEETRRLEHIIGDLLELARLEGGGQRLRTDPVPVARLFDRIAARHERELHQRRIHLRQEIDARATTVRGDADRLEQALQNLASNALHHTPDDGTIALSATWRDGVIVLAVRDTGPGVPDAHLPLIFDRFYKADSSRAGAGSGLGLSIVKAIVERHGGTVAVRNDGGAVFEVTLPPA